MEKSAITTLNAQDCSRENLHLGTTNTIYECHLRTPLLGYMQENRNVNTKITISHSMELLHALQDDLLDFAFTYIPLKKQGFHCQCFKKDELVLVCRFSDTKYQTGITRKELPKLNYLFCNLALQEDVYKRQDDNSGCGKKGIQSISVPGSQKDLRLTPPHRVYPETGN